MKIFWSAVISMTVRGVGYGVLFGALYGLAFAIFFVGLRWYILIGAFYGAVFGGVTGLITGIASGLCIGLVTRGLFDPLTNSELYRRVVGITSAVVTFVSAEVGLTILFDGGINRPDGLTLLFYFLLPSLIAVAVATYTGLGFANRYIARSNSEWPKEKTTPPSALITHNF